MKIIKVIDTREKMEVEGRNGKTRLVGIPGTGEDRPCDLCQTLHEIHVHVEMDDKSVTVVGQGCGNKTWPKFKEEMKKYSDARELESLKSEMGYKFEKVQIHPYYKIKDWYFEIDGQKFNVCNTGCWTEKDAVMVIVKKKFKDKKQVFFRYFRIMDGMK